MARKSIFEPEFRDDLRWWVENYLRVALRALEIVESSVRDPFVGIGKPEPMKHVGSGVWSRRLTQEHRVVYRVSADAIHFLQARYHY